MSRSQILRLRTREECDGSIDGILLLPEGEDVAVGLGAVEDVGGMLNRLSEAVILELLVHLAGVQELGVEAGEQHVDHNLEVDFVVGRM